MKGHIIASTIAFILFTVLAVLTANAMDREFIINYSQSTGIPVESIRVCEETDLFEDEYFESEYGLCIVFNHRFTDEDVENQ